MLTGYTGTIDNRDIWIHQTNSISDITTFNSGRNNGDKNTFNRVDRLIPPIIVLTGYTGTIDNRAVWIQQTNSISDGTNFNGRHNNGDNNTFNRGYRLIPPIIVLTGYTGTIDNRAIWIHQTNSISDSTTFNGRHNNGDKNTLNRGDRLIPPIIVLTGYTGTIDNRAFWIPQTNSISDITTFNSGRNNGHKNNFNRGYRLIPPIIVLTGYTATIDNRAFWIPQTNSISDITTFNSGRSNGHKNTFNRGDRLIPPIIVLTGFTGTIDNRDIWIHQTNTISDSTTFKHFSKQS